ncbi:MAG TPA: zinc-dependent alcohol dehydrogenase family protein [Thermoanaerobaculia bacterium]|nr:zinc-dependent alcohol dehydrogenase family protein [Thermoanaerobaculia bacterium]
MKAMLLDAPGGPLRLAEVPDPEPGPGQLLLRVRACAVCRTDLHVVDGDLREPKLPLVLGHEIVGVVEAAGEGGSLFAKGDRVGVPWLGATCGRCRYCLEGAENLCDEARFTGYHRDGGFAELAVADERFCFPIPAELGDVEAAPLLCAGLIGHRTLRMAGDPQKVGIWGFGAAAHLVAQVARYEGREVFAFTRPGDSWAQEFARSLGAVWAGGSDELPAEPLDAALVFAPIGALVPAALRSVRKGGVVVCGGIHMTDLPSFPYELLWGERVVRSVANLTRRDGEEFLAVAARAGVKSQVRTYPLSAVNEALEDLREGRLEGAAVVVP